MTSKKILIGVGAVVLMTASNVAFASPGKGDRHKGPEARIERMDLNKDGVITKAEAMQAAEERFAKMDLNNDGEVTKEELRDGRQAQREARQAERFARLDTDNSGDISAEEFDNRKSSAMFGRLDDDNDGVISKEEMENMRGRFGGRHKKFRN